MTKRSLHSKFNWVVIQLLLLPIRIYQAVISPWLGNQCRFQPTCSVYAKEAILKKGPLVGCWLTLKRLIKCHPWGGSGYDPVPE